MEQNKNVYNRKKNAFEKAGDVVEEFMNGFLSEFIIHSIAQALQRRKKK